MYLYSSFFFFFLVKYMVKCLVIPFHMFLSRICRIVY